MADILKKVFRIKDVISLLRFLLIVSGGLIFLGMQIATAKDQERRISSLKKTHEQDMQSLHKRIDRFEDRTHENTLLILKAIKKL